jgi:hypothetical protein
MGTPDWAILADGKFIGDAHNSRGIAAAFKEIMPQIEKFHNPRKRFRELLWRDRGDMPA